MVTFFSNTFIPHIVALSFIVLHRHHVFYKLKVFGNSVLRSLWMPFFRQYFSSSWLCVTFWEISQYFKLFHYCICYGYLCSVIFNVTIIIVLESHEPRLSKVVKLVDKCVCSDCSTDWPFPSFSPSLWASLFSETEQHWNYIN